MPVYGKLFVTSNKKKHIDEYYKAIESKNYY